ncbi:hypothetical protein Lal_00048243 [Lupinus albus]|nr:hypothetical protein Lal_00048243 [Lupinus albus]
MKEAWKSTSNRWSVKDKYSPICEASLNKMEGLMMMYGNEENGMMVKKRVMVVVDNTSYSKHAMMWTLTHVTNKVDFLTLLHVVPPHKASQSSCSTNIVNYLGSLCKNFNPEFPLRNHENCSAASAFLFTVSHYLSHPHTKLKLSCSDKGESGSTCNSRTKTDRSDESSEEARTCVETVVAIQKSLLSIASIMQSA